MTKHLLLVDYENVHKIDLSVLDESYRAIIFVGASQSPPKAARRPATAHRFSRVEFQQIAGTGKNALDFHIAFHLGRTFETAPDTVCIVLSRDKGFDPLLLHLNKSGLRCHRVGSFEELVPAPAPSTESVAPIDLDLVVCSRCKTAHTIEHHGGRWCTNCGSFATPPDPTLLPSHLPGYREPATRNPLSDRVTRDWRSGGGLVCGWCHQQSDMRDGIYDDGEWMCGGCVADFVR